MWSDFFNKNGLEQYVKDPTYYSKIGGYSILDLVLAPQGTDISALVVDPERFGPEFDHYSVEFSVDMKFSTDKTLKLIRKPNKDSWKKVREDLIDKQLDQATVTIARTPKFPDQEKKPFHPMYFDLVDTYVHDPYEEVEEDISENLTKTFVEIYKNATTEIVVKSPPPGGHLDHWTKKTIRHGKRLSKTIKWAAINGSWSEERLTEAREKRKRTKKNSKPSWKHSKNGLTTMG